MEYHQLMPQRQNFQGEIVPRSAEQQWVGHNDPEDGQHVFLTLLANPRQSIISSADGISATHRARAKAHSRPPARFTSLLNRETVNQKQGPWGNTLLAQRYPSSGNSYFWRTGEEGLIEWKHQKRSTNSKGLRIASRGWRGFWLIRTWIWPWSVSLCAWRVSGPGSTTWRNYQVGGED